MRIGPTMLDDLELNESIGPGAAYSLVLASCGDRGVVGTSLALIAEVGGQPRSGRRRRN